MQIFITWAIASFVCSYLFAAVSVSPEQFDYTFPRRTIKGAMKFGGGITAIVGWILFGVPALVGAICGCALLIYVSFRHT
jgi:hypothetical protein